MSVKPETTYYQGLLKHLPDVYVEKMANPFRAGTPDLWLSGRADDLWLEVKYLASLPKTASTVVKYGLTPRQQQWLTDRHAEGRHVGALIGSPQGGLLLLGLDWKNAIPAVDFKQLAVGRERIAVMIRNLTGTSPCKTRSSAPSSRQLRASQGSTG